MAEIFRFDGYIRLNNEIRPFLCKIGQAEKSLKSDYYCCLFASPPVLSEEKRIYGMTGSQAESLAREFLSKIFRNHEILDEAKNLVEL
ncbi:MAG: hypothetical protein AAFW68_06690 [Pseudomonadota bacterium]